MGGKNDSLEVFLPGRGLGTFPGRYSITMAVVLWIKQPRVCASEGSFMWVVDATVF